MTAQADLSCRELVELVTAYLEGALPQRDRERFEAHLRACDGCSAYLAQVRQVTTAAGRLHEEHLEPATRSALLAAFRGWRRGGG